MSKRIETLKESPCYQCGCQDKCLEKVRRSPKLMDICDMVIGNSEFDYHNCGIWVALNAPEMIEVEDD